ncbi:hypothetical protein POI8812_03325 [Pontivivens insulae]|uniref:Uncharacterized protein n=1 Tax=Pontivivens insulae TaxID=1639689 RepID=A0A2R8AFV4_9RHOB|nr:hypothetical protein DFR53_2938 [Pontivivens insulae]SPF30978.1 hypothetical protein POI8812_03325 [Pontivivens insulae]
MIRHRFSITRFIELFLSSKCSERTGFDRMACLSHHCHCS